MRLIFDKENGILGLEDKSGKLQFEHVLERDEKIEVTDNPKEVETTSGIQFTNLTDLFGAISVGWEGME